MGQVMNILESRERLICRNDGSIAALCAQAGQPVTIAADADEVIKAAALSQREAAVGQFKVRTVELRCECGDPSCTTLINITPSDFSIVRYLDLPGKFVCARGHDKPNLETGHEMRKAADWICVSQREGWDMPLDTDTLAANLTSQTAETDANRLEVDAGLSCLAGLMVTGTVVLPHRTDCYRSIRRR
jgi:hypothetical protein